MKINDCNEMYIQSFLKVLVLNGSRGVISLSGINFKILKLLNVTHNPLFLCLAYIETIKHLLLLNFKRVLRVKQELSKIDPLRLINKVVVCKKYKSVI